MSNAERKGLPVRVKMRHDQHFVDELTSGKEPVGRMIPMAVITPNPDQPRTAMGNLDELVDSIGDKGILEPILVRALAMDEAAPRGVEFLIISGERRFQAARKAGLVEVPAIVMDVDHDEALEIALIENLQRKDLTPFEVAEGYQALREVHGYTHEEVAKAVGKSRTSVTESLALLKLAPEVRSAAEALGVESKSTLLEVAKVSKSVGDQIALLERVASEGLNRKELRETVKAATGRRTRPAKSAKRPTFTFKDPDKAFSVSLRFRQETVERQDLISALERILADLRDEETSST